MRMNGGGVSRSGMNEGEKETEWSSNEGKHAKGEYSSIKGENISCTSYRKVTWRFAGTYQICFKIFFFNFNFQFPLFILILIFNF